jgi:hypothetical protein
MTRNGKIARLPKVVREALNRRMENNEQGKPLLEWLNGLPEVREILMSQFGGMSISKQNFSEWRQGGHHEWLVQQEALKMVGGMAADADELKQLAAEPLTDKLAPWLVARYFMAVKKSLAAGDGTGDLKLLHEFCADMVALRRGDHGAARLKMEQERMALEPDGTEGEMLEQFQRWAKNAEVQEWILDNTSTSEEKRMRLRQIFGLPTEKPEEENPETSTVAADPADGAESNPVKPSQTKSNQIKPEK